MADAKLTALTAASALAAADLFYVSQSAASRKATGTQLLALVGTAYVPLTGGTMTGALTIASGTLTASAPALNITQTWNNAAIGFVGALIDITNTVSAGASYPLIIKVNGANMFEFTKAGRLNNLQVSTGILQCTYADFGSSGDTLLYRDAAATLAQRNGTNAQTLRVYGTYTDSSNYERLSLSTTAGSGVTIAAETLGTGADNLHIALLPAGTGKVGIGIAVPLWNLHVEGTSAAEMALRDSTGTFVNGVISGIAYLTTTTSNPIVFRPNSTERFRVNVGGLVTFGGVTSSVPGLKPSGTTLLARLGDDSADAPFSALYVKTASTTVAGLTAAATAGAGARAFVTDANATTDRSVVAGGGANKVPVFSDGTNWLIG